MSFRFAFSSLCISPFLLLACSSSSGGADTATSNPATGAGGDAGAGGSGTGGSGGATTGGGGAGAGGSLGGSGAQAGGSAAGGPGVGGSSGSTATGGHAGSPGAGGDDTGAGGASIGGSNAAGGSSGGTDAGGGHMGGNAMGGGFGGTAAGGATQCSPLSASGPCYPTDVSCGLPGSSCMARTSNCGVDLKSFRLSQLQVKQPAKLSNTLVEFSIIRAGIDLNLPQCNLLDGSMGSFNWLLQIDPQSAQLTTGGSLPMSDPDAGFCFLDKMVPGGLLVQKETTPYTTDSTGALSGSAITKLEIPIFNDASASTPPIVLPLSQLTLSGIDVSEDGNCIGRFKGMSGELDDSTCKPLSTTPTMDTSFQWKNGGSMTGYITLKDADAIPVVLIGASLCTLLSGQMDPNDKSHCPHDANGNITVKGDTSSIENPGSMDAYQFTAGFAASAVKINGDCN